jgi:hypothetical protein
MARPVAVLLSSLLLASATLAQNSPAPKFRTPPAKLSMPMVAPLFLDDKDFSSTVTLVNDAIAQMKARVVVLDSSGVQVAFREVVMPGHTSLPIQIRDLLSEAGSAANFGSVLVIPQPVEGMPIGAQLSIASKTGATPAYIEEEMLPQDEGRQGIYRAAALSVKGSPIIALKSLAQGIQSVTLQCFAEKTGPTRGTVQLIPGQLLLVAACDPAQTGLAAVNSQMFDDQIDRGSVGIAVSTTGTPGDLITFGFSIYNDERGPYFSSLNFSNPTEQRSSATIFTGIPVGAADLFPRTIFRSEVAVSNFSAKPAEVSITLAHTIAGKTSTELVQKLVLAGQSSRVVQIPAHGDPALTNSLIVQSSLPPGEVAAQFTAWGDVAVRTVELQGKDADSPQNGGGHPWDIHGGSASTLLLFNHGYSATKKIDVQISSGDEFWWKAYQLAPMETKAININDLVARSVPDDSGHFLSKTTAEGQVAWFSGFPKWAKGRLMVSRPGDGLARSFSCGTCNTDCNHSSMSPNSSITIADGGSNYLGNIKLQTCSISCLQMGCGSTVTGQTMPSATRWNPPDGTIYYTGSGGLTRFTATGTSAGTGSESFNTQDDAGQGNNCWSGGSGSITVEPTITISYNPGYVYIGQDPTVTQANLMGGSGTPSGGTYAWSSTKSGISFDNNQAQLVHVTATTWTGGTNDTPITLNYTDNGVAAAPATVSITQRIFKYLAGDSVILLSQYNGPSTYGYLYQANYNVFANPGGQQVTTGSGISTYENVTLISSNVPFNPTYGQGALNSNSQVVDSLKLTNNTPLPSNLSIVDSQDLGVGGIYVRNNTLTYTASGLTVTSNGPYN